MNVKITKHGMNIMAEYTDFQFYFSGIRVNSDRIEATLKITHQGTVLFYSRTELMDITKRWQLARHLKYLMDNILWEEVLTVVFTKVISHLYKYEPPHRLSPVPVQNHYWIYPLLADPFTLIFSAGGSGKSYLSLYLSLLIQNGVDSLFLQLDKPYNVLYLDWETSLEDISRRYTLLTGADDGFEWQSPFYRNVSFPLKMVYDEIVNDIVNYDIKLIVIDSVVPAIGGTINNADAVGEFFSILKQFYKINGTRTLLLTHVSKQDKREDNNKSPIGSVYFENYPRLVWELRSISLQNKLNLELVPFKANVPFPNPVSFIFEFMKDRVIVSAAEMEATDELENFVKQLLEKNGPTKLKDIADTAKKELGVYLKDVRKVLNKLIKAGTVFQPEYGYYAIGSQPEEKQTTKTTQNDDDLPPF